MNEFEGAVRCCVQVAVEGGFLRGNLANLILSHGRGMETSVHLLVQAASRGG